MPLQKQPLNINFTQGLDQKSDPKQIPIGKFARLVNQVFQKTGLLQKRNGFGSSLPALDSTKGFSYVTTFGNNLTAIAREEIDALSQGSQTWIKKGFFVPSSLSVLPVGRSALNETQCDCVTSANNFVCTVYTEVNTGVSTNYKYAVQDSNTGQYIVAPTVIPVTAGIVNGSPRVFLLGGYFVIVFTTLISATSHLQYIALSTNSPSTIVQTSTDIAAAYISSSTLSWDGVVVGNNLYLAYNTTAGGQQIAVTYLSSAFVVAAAASFAASIGTTMSVCADITNPSKPVIYAAFWDSAGSTGNVVAVDTNLNSLMNATQWLGSGTINNVTCVAQNGVATILYENASAYSYDNTIPSNFIKTNTVTLPATLGTGTLGTATTMLRSVGLASKAFIGHGNIYALVSYSSVFQPTYFLSDFTGNIIGKLAYQNGGGYLHLGLPQAQKSTTASGIPAISIPYLFKDLIAPVNKTQGVANAAGVYSQTGINLATFMFSSNTLSTSEIGNNLLLSAGLLFAYDGNSINEQNFNVYPDNIEVTWTENSVVTPTGTFSNASTSVVVSSASGISVGMTITDTSNSSYIPTGTVITGINGTTLTISQKTTHSGSGDNLSIQGNVASKPDGSTNASAYFVQVIYQWMDKQGNIFNSAPSIPVAVTTTGSVTTGTITVNGPNLRLTYKTNVRIIIYRWSVGQQNYYQTTSVVSPLLNSTTTDSWTYVDTLPDSSILGNGLIYTTGGVVENVGGPACSAMTLFDTRLWLVDAEDPNLLWYSKQVIEGTPVEMSDLFTNFIAPNAGTAASTGPITCIFPMDDKLIIFKKDAIYYINGSGPDNTGANSQYSQPIFITSTVGCIAQSSIVFIPEGLMFQSDKGIWLLGRDLSTGYIGAPVEDSNSASVTSALAIPGTTQVRFTLNNQTTLMYDYFYKQWGTFTNVNAISSCLYQDLQTYISSFGTVAQETPGQYLDNGNPVLMGLTTGWLNLAGLRGYERFYRMFLLGQYFSPHKIQVGIGYDYAPGISQQVYITPNNFSGVYGSDALYGDDTYGGVSAVERWRIFPSRQKCSAFQLTINEVFDPSFGVPAGAGFSLSGLNLILGMKKGYAPIRASESTG